jgi:NTE family protein
VPEIQGDVFTSAVRRRLNELGVLSRVAVISSVSGGSILNGMLAAKWTLLASDHNRVA